MEVGKLTNLSLEDYIAIEQDTQIKHEYHNGRIFALAGGTLNHGLICGNIFAELRSILKNSNSKCKSFSSEFKLHIPKGDFYLMITLFKSPLGV